MQAFLGVSAIVVLLAFWLGCRIGSMDLRGQLVAQGEELQKTRQLLQIFKDCYEAERGRRQAMAGIVAEHPHD